MGIRAWWRGRTAPAPVASSGQGRQWLAAAPSRLLADLPAGAMATPNREIRQSLAVLRARSRWLAQNDGYSKGFLRLLRRNVVGAAGFTLQMRVKADRGAGFDDDANARLEAAWQAWCLVGACDVTGRLSFADVLRLLIVGIARDGEALVRKVTGAQFAPHGFALQVLDPAILDEQLVVAPGGAFAGRRLPAGCYIRAGVEMDGWSRPVAYWLRATLQGDDAQLQGGATHVRVPAAEVLHLFVTDWPGAQARGVPWLEAAVRALAMLDGYAEAELTAARVAASKMGFYQQAEGEEQDGELQQDGALVQQAEAGSFELLPKGVKLETFDPQHPNSGFGAFCSGILRQASAGAGVSYNAFANDAAGLNYSALRATALEDRDEYRVLQDWLIGSFARPVFSAWLKAVLLSGATGLPAGKAWKFDAPRFVPRGWQWVDPASEMQAAAGAVALRVKSRTQIVAEGGGDLEATIAELKAEETMMAGLPAMQLPGAAAPAASPSTSKDA